MCDLKNAFKEYFSYSCIVEEFWISIINNIDSLLRPLKNQTEQLRLCQRAVLGEEFLNQFPDIQDRLVGKIIVGIEAEMRSVFNVQEDMKLHLDALKTRFNTVEKEYSRFSPENLGEFDALIPSYENLLEHALDLWRFYHVLWIDVRTSIEMIDYSEKKTVEAVEKCLLKYNKIKTHIQYISSLTYYLRTQTNPIDQR